MKLLAIVLLIHASIAVVNPSSRITGGQDAYPGQFPYQVAIQYGFPPVIPTQTVCGGSIINKKWILTSARCLTSIPNIGKILVKAGKHELFKDSEYVQTSEVSLRLVHKDYKSSNIISHEIHPYDIGLLKLKTSLQFNERVKAISLPKAFSRTNGSAILTGWGSISTHVIPKLAKVLQVVKVKILSKPNCEDAIRSVKPSQSISDVHICSGPLDKPISACIGDSGDPLVQLKGADKKPIQIGIASWSTYPCGKQGVPTVYTLVSPFVYWIQERITENS